MPLECRLKTRRGEHLHNISRHVIQAERHGPLPVLRHSVVATADPERWDGDCSLCA
jgi:hypothetical protein